LERVSVTVMTSGAEVDGAATVVVKVSTEPDGVVSVTVTVTAGTLTVWPLLRVTETVGLTDGTLVAGTVRVSPLDSVTVTVGTLSVTEMDGTETTVWTGTVCPLERVSVTVMVWDPEVLWAGTVVVKVSMEPDGVCSETVTVTAGTVTVLPSERVTMVDVTDEAGTVTGTEIEGTETTVETVSVCPLERVSVT
jgi:hypothetical protein